MPEHVDFHAMNDHDLLVTAVLQGNEVVTQLEQLNGTVRQHDKKIENNRANISWIAKIGGGLLTVITGLVALILKLAGVF